MAIIIFASYNFSRNTSFLYPLIREIDPLIFIPKVFSHSKNVWGVFRGTGDR